jgi:hypothetical protein
MSITTINFAKKDVEFRIAATIGEVAPSENLKVGKAVSAECPLCKSENIAGSIRRVWLVRFHDAVTISLPVMK